MEKASWSITHLHKQPHFQITFILGHLHLLIVGISFKTPMCNITVFLIGYPKKNFVDNKSPFPQSI